MTNEEYIDFANALKNNYTIDFDKLPEFCDMAISALKETNDIEKSNFSKEQYKLDVDTAYKCGYVRGLKERPKGEWKRMSNLPEDKDDRYECSRCGNVIHYKHQVDLYTFNSWCGRCGSLNNPSRYDER